MTLTLVASTDAIELVGLNYPDLNIKHPNCGYDEATRERSGW